MSSVLLQAVFGVSLGLVFTASAIPKLRRPQSFILAVMRYQVLRPSLARRYALTVPALEVLVGLLLLTGTAVASASLLASCLLATFLVGIGVNIAAGRNPECGCIGSLGQRRVGWGAVAQDLVLLSVALVLCVDTGAGFTLARWSPLRLLLPSNGESPAAVVVVLAVLVSAGVAIRSSNSSDQATASGTLPPAGGNANGT